MGGQDCADCSTCIRSELYVVCSQYYITIDSSYTNTSARTVRSFKRIRILQMQYSISIGTFYKLCVCFKAYSRQEYMVQPT
jgi:hypothetical protein